MQPVDIVVRVRRAWRRFWFRGQHGGGRIACAMVRIGVAVSVLLVLHSLHVSDYQADLPRRALSLYQPDGILQLLGRHVPPPALLNVCRLLGWASTVSLLLGLFTRTSHIVSLISSLVLVSYEVSFVTNWPHQWNVVLVAHAALVLARSGDAISVDRWLARRRGIALALPPLGYQWSVRLALLATASMYFNAFLHKIIQAHGTLRWALSDNLRNHLLLRFDWVGAPRTPVASWLMKAAWRYETAACLNLVSQLAPIFAFVFFRRPRVRAILGCFFVVETVALGVVMDLWNLHWLPLAVVFVDWDHLVAWWRARRRGAGDPAHDGGSVPPTRAPDTAGGWWAWAGRTYLLSYLLLHSLSNFVPGFDLAYRTFPFSRFAMFSAMRVKEPYGVPQAYEFYGNRLEPVGVEVSPAARRWLDSRYAYRWLHRDRPAQIEKKVAAAAREATARFHWRNLTAMRAHLVLFRAPPRPRAPTLEEQDVAVLAEKVVDGPIRSLRGRFVGSNRVRIAPHGFGPDATLTALYVIDGTALPARPIPIVEGAGTYRLPPSPSSSSLRIVLADVRYGGHVRRFVVAISQRLGW